MIYPEDKFKVWWDFLVSLDLLVMCIFTPLSIAFTQEREDVFSTQNIIHLAMDFVFFLDIFVVFFSALHDADFKIIDDFREIASQYMKGWFLIDIVAIIPYDHMVSTDTNISGISMVRIVKLGRISKILKLTRLIRMLKMMK